MTKPKLTSAVKSPAASGKAAQPAADQSAAKTANPTTGATAGNGGDAPRSATADDADPDDSADDDDSAGDPAASASDSNKPDGKAPAAGAAAPAAVTTDSTAPKSLADFRSAFGHELGSVFFADAVPFVDACVKHMATQQTTITAQAAKIAELSATGTSLADQLKGETDPIVTGDKGDAAATADPVGSFAASAEKRLKSGKAKK